MKYTYKTKPRPYQRRALKKMLDVERGALWMPMRSGKSKVAVDWASVLTLKYGPQRALVVTHSPTTFGVWRNEIRKHCPLIEYSEKRGTGDYIIYEEEPELSEIPFQILIVNVQSVYARDMHETDRGWDPIPREDIMRWGPTILIVDEATCIGDDGALQTKMLYRLQREAGIRFKLMLTGTPMHRNLLKAFGQFKVMDDSIFGTTFKGYKTQYAVFGGYLDKTLLRYRNVKRWRKKVAPRVFQLRRVPLRPPVEQVIPVELSPATWAKYDDMEKEALVEIDGETILAPIVLTRLLKAAQIAAGNVRDEDGRWHRVGTELHDAFQDHVGRLKESSVKRLVVYARHIPELRDAAVALQEAGYSVAILHGGVPPAGRERRIAWFHEPGGYKAFVSQISTGSMGIDLSCADTTIYYTLTESLLHFDQSKARTLDWERKKRTLTIYYMIPRGTVLETMYLALKTKMDLVDFVLKHKTLIHHEEVG